MASSAVDFVIGKIFSIIENEASSLIGVSDEIQEMKVLLRSMRSFLIDADRTGESSQSQKARIDSVRDVACEVEDTIDEFTYHMNMLSQLNFFQRSLYFPQDLLVRYKVAAKLQGINKKIQSITERTHQFGDQDLEEMVRPKKKQRRIQVPASTYDPNWKKRLSESSLFFREDDLVGIKKAQHELLAWLMNEEPRRTVISVVGMGGSGKTTLVANTFNKQVVRQHFDFCAWITVSQQYIIEELFRSLLKEVYRKAKIRRTMVMLNSMGYKELLEELVGYLQSRRYLIVLDDVWSIKLWQEISIALPEGFHGSRIMLTTRKEDVAPFQSGFISHIHHIQPLKEDEAWKLFCIRAFPNNLDGCPADLHSLAWNLVRRCKGLPLAITTLSGLMSSKRSIIEWKRVHDNLDWGNAALEVVRNILLLSYHDLPFQLKQCFLYCSIFPEDYKIHRKRLFRLWMAEGFLEQVNDVPPEVVAESYLMELVCRSLLQVTHKNITERPNAFQMHDLLREFALSISKAEKLVAVSDGRKGIEENGIRRYSIEVKDKEMKSENGTTSQLRSFFIFLVGEISKSSFNRLPSGFKLIKVLDLEGAPISELSSELGNFFNLKYLNLTGTQVKVLPKSIGKLLNLQTLLLKHTKVVWLPCEIVKLQNLRHLSASYYDKHEIDLVIARSISVPPNICMIKSLQVLSHVRGTRTLIKQLEEMTQLTNLGLDILSEDDEKDLCFSIAKMKRLVHLKLGAEGEVKLKMDALKSAPPYLERLDLYGELERVPHWFDTLVNLSQLILRFSKLREDALVHLQALPNLSYLWFSDNAYEGEHLWFLEGFQKLKILRLRSCPRLNEIVIAKGVMPALLKLSVIQCKLMRALPNGWEHLTELIELRFYDVSNELVQTICAKGSRLPSTPYISLIRFDHGDDTEPQCKWVSKIHNI